eukprot:7378852-Prymnesium_polylepis.2
MYWSAGWMCVRAQRARPPRDSAKDLACSSRCRCSKEGRRACSCAQERRISPPRNDFARDAESWGRRLSINTALSSDASVSPTHGISPVSNSHRMMPKEYTSLAAMYAFLKASGALLTSDPHALLPARLVCPSTVVFEASPKSVICGRQIRVGVEIRWRRVP